MGNVRPLYDRQNHVSTCKKNTTDQGNEEKQNGCQRERKETTEHFCLCVMALASLMTFAEKSTFYLLHGTPLAAVYVGENLLICELFVLSFECNAGDMRRYDDLRSRGLRKYEGKHHL